LTTHTRALLSEFNNENIIFDEDPINSLINIQSLEISDLVKFDNNTEVNHSSLKTTINFLQSKIPGEIIKTLVLCVDLDQIIEQVSRTSINSDIFSFFQSEYLMKDPITPNTVHYVVKNELPITKKVIIMSATIPVYI
jgi:hypothetical protein